MDLKKHVVCCMMESMKENRKSDMEKNQILWNELCGIAGSDNVLKDEPMMKHTTFRIGGPADFFVLPKSPEAVRDLVRFLKTKEVPFYIMGNGSNLLVGDRGYRGVVIQLFKNLDAIEISGTRVKAQAGALLSRIARKALDAGLTGMEFASGIPGTLGGALTMNAGAYGGEMKQVLETVSVLTKEGEFLSLTAEEMEMGYRTSRIAREQDTVLEAVLKLEQGDRTVILERMEELKEKRVTKQPLEYPSAGSTFKRPEGYFAGKLIMDTGLRGFSVGGAQVSEKHCGFVINKGGATAADVCALMKEVADRVEEKFGVRLEPEVKMLGEFE